MADRIFTRDEDFGLAELLVERAREFGGLGVDDKMLDRLDAVAARHKPVDSYSKAEQDEMAAALREIHWQLKEKLGIEGMFEESGRSDMPTLPPPPPSEPYTSDGDPADEPFRPTTLDLIRREHIRAVRLSRVIGGSVEGIPYRAFVRNHLDQITDLLTGFVERRGDAPRVVDNTEAKKTVIRVAKDLDAVDVLSVAGPEVLRTYAGGAITDISALLYEKGIRHGGVIHSISQRLQDAVAAGDRDTLAFSLMEFEIRKNALFEPLVPARGRARLDEATSLKIDGLIQLARGVARNAGYDIVAGHLEKRIAQLEDAGDSCLGPVEMRSLVAVVDHDVDVLMRILRADAEKVFDDLIAECREDAQGALELIESREIALQEEQGMAKSTNDLMRAIAFQNFAQAREGLAGLHIQTSRIMLPYGPLMSPVKAGGAGILPGTPLLRLA